MAITLALGFFFRDHIALITDGVRKNKIQCVKPDFPTLVASAHHIQILTKIQFNPMRVPLILVHIVIKSQF